MNLDYWQKQDTSKPLFEDLLWSKPQQKSKSGKLLIVGGNLHAVTAPGTAFDTARKQEVGEVKVLLPDATKKFFGSKAPTEILFAHSTPSGSFSTQAENEVKSYLDWADGVLLAGDFGSNSETTVLLEKIAVTDNLKIFTQDAIDNLTKTPEMLLQNSYSALVLNTAQLQKLVTAIKYPRAVKSDVALMQLIEFLHDFGKIFPAHLVLSHQDEIFVSSGGQIVTTKITGIKSLVELATSTAVWWLQNPSKPLKALTTAVV